MKNALLIHGWNSKAEYQNMSRPTPSNDHWFPWLTKQLIVKDIHTVALEMPHGYYPEYEVWKKELERFELTPETILVGHSCGGGFLVRYLSEHPDLKVHKVILVAPWLGGGATIDFFDMTFFDFTIDPTIADRADDFVMISSTNDMADVQTAVARIREEVTGGRDVVLKDKGHFTILSLGTQEFPELLDEIRR